MGAGHACGEPVTAALLPRARRPEAARVGWVVAVGTVALHPRFGLRPANARLTQTHPAGPAPSMAMETGAATSTPAHR
jgi:hypothetical protein